MKHRTSWILLICATVLAALAFVRVSADRDPPNTGMADPVALVSAFDRFAAGGAPGNVVILSLSNLRGVSSEAVNAGGRVVVDLATGTVGSNVQLLPLGDTFDLWLIDNQPGPGHTTLAEHGDTLKKVGTYAVVAGRHRLSVPLGPAAFTSFFPDRAFVVRSGESPVDGFVLTGPSTFFARLRHRQVRFVDDATVALGFDPTAADTREADLARAIAQGRRLFLKETFEGNGRTCGTCHVETNNFTVDPQLIATLPPTDPLFVAETNPALATLENSDLLRRFGLILVNADGFDASRGFVFRGTQNVQALSNSTTPQDPSFFIDFSTNGRNPNPPERLGWGNDGPPLRDFALVAIAQHAPTTLGRTPGVDFRVPTDEELDALVAYQLSLGRQEDFNLPTLELKSTLATSGKTLYLDSGNLFEPGHKNCNGCHFNGGGSAGMSFNDQTPGFPDIDGSPRGFNIGAGTNTNEIPLALKLGLPRDGGFGQILDGIWLLRQHGRPASAVWTSRVRGVQQSPSCGVSRHGPVLPQPYGQGSGVRSGVLWNPGLSEHPAHSHTGEHQRGSQRSRGAGDRRIPTRPERFGEHPFRHQCRGTRTENDKSRRYARTGRPGARGDYRCDGGLVGRSIGRSRRTWRLVGSRQSAGRQADARNGAPSG